MKNTLTTWCARGLMALVSLSVAAAAQASTIYDFTFTNTGTGAVFASGSFTTGAANTSDPGYFLLDSLTISVTDSTSKTWGPFVSSSMPAEPSYNPTTQTFTNFDMTGTQPGLGDVIFHESPAQATIILDTTSFIISKHYFSAAVQDHSGSFPFPPAVPVAPTAGTVNLAITAAPTAVPEPTSLVLLGTGLFGALISRQRASVS